MNVCQEVHGRLLWGSPSIEQYNGQILCEQYALYTGAAVE
jgi:hypothetical protein